MIQLTFSASIEKDLKQERLTFIGPFLKYRLEN